VSHRIRHPSRFSRSNSSSEWELQGTAIHILSLEVGNDSVVSGDTIESDIFGNSADPESVTRLTVKELGFPIEFANAIAWKIRW
jgi:hypothetical protein